MPRPRKHPKKPRKRPPPRPKPDSRNLKHWRAYVSYLLGESKAPEVSHVELTAPLKRRIERGPSGPDRTEDNLIQALENNPAPEAAPKNSDVTYYSTYYPKISGRKTIGKSKSTSYSFASRGLVAPQALKLLALIEHNFSPRLPRGVSLERTRHMAVDYVALLALGAMPKLALEAKRAKFRTRFAKEAAAGLAKRFRTTTPAARSIIRQVRSFLSKVPSPL